MKARHREVSILLKVTQLASNGANNLIHWGLILTHSDRPTGLDLGLRGFHPSMPAEAQCCMIIALPKAPSSESTQGTLGPLFFKLTSQPELAWGYQAFWSAKLWSLPGEKAGRKEAKFWTQHLVLPNPILRLTLMGHFKGTPRQGCMCT